MTDVETDAIVDDTDVQPTAARTRRGVFGRLYHGETAIDFYGRRWWGLGLSIALLLLSIGSLVGQGLNLSLDFKGGVVWSVPSADLTEEQARRRRCVRWWSSSCWWLRSSPGVSSGAWPVPPFQPCCTTCC